MNTHYGSPFSPVSQVVFPRIGYDYTRGNVDVDIPTVATYGDYGASPEKKLTRLQRKLARLQTRAAMHPNRRLLSRRIQKIQAKLAALAPYVSSASSSDLASLEAEMAAAEAEVGIPTDSSALPVPTSGGMPSWLIPMLAIGAVGLLALILMSGKSTPATSGPAYRSNPRRRRRGR